MSARLRTFVVFAAACLLPMPAGAQFSTTANPVAPGLLDNAYRFVAQSARKRSRQLAVGLVDIRVTESAGPDFDQNLVFGGLRRRHLG